MNKYSLSIINSLLAAILICGMLAACGAAEKSFAAPKNISETVSENVPANISNTVEQPAPEVSPEVPEESFEEEPAAGQTEKTDAEMIIETAKENLGVKYASNECTPEKGFDSSGFVYYCFKEQGIDIPRRVKDQIKAGEEVSYDELKPGDVAFFSAEEGGKANFCGIYAGGGLIIYSPAPGGAVKTSNITTSYWTARFVSGARFI